ncbi:hypothetical protein PanWU01x14_104720 [Parasponia andersonii]|uniref:Uncharacterized protein n=1 Tax=Parasponia andersonii TaxID=3476 RepID=A0A2P5D1Y4_PARAD|nr:hypothetical protein PanWU01x14_104720 [Parasponia andersonii]
MMFTLRSLRGGKQVRASAVSGSAPGARGNHPLRVIRGLLTYPGCPESPGLHHHGGTSDYGLEQLTGPNDLVAPTSHELEEAVKLVAKECAKFSREETATPKRAKSSDVGPSADPSPVKGKTAVHKAHSKVPAGRCLVVSSEDEASGVVILKTSSKDDLEGLFMTGDETPIAPTPKAGQLVIRETPAIKIVYGKGVPSSLPDEPSVPTSSTPSSGSKAGTGSSAAHSRREITELSEGLSSPTPVTTKQGRDADLSSEKESPVGKRGRAALSSGSEDDGVTLTLMRRRRRGSKGAAAETADVAAVVVISSTEDASPSAVTESALGDALPPTVLISATSGASEEAIEVHLVEGHNVLTVETAFLRRGQSPGKGSSCGVRVGGGFSGEC